MTINVWGNYEPINNRLDPRMLIFAQFQVASQILQVAIDSHSPITLQAHLFEHLFPILAKEFEDGRSHLHFRSVRQRHQVLEHLPRGPCGDRLFATGAGRRPNRRV